MSSCLNLAPLQFWKNSGYTSKDVEEVGIALDERYMMARFQFRPGQPVAVTISKRVHETRQGHFPTIIEFFETIQSEWRGEPLSGDILVLLEDGLWEWLIPHARKIPILSFSRLKHDHYSFLMPDPAFLDSEAYAQDKDIIDKYESLFTWQTKKPTVFWRGSSSGLEITRDDWQKNSRIQLALASLRINDSDKLDAYLSRVIPLEPKSLEERIYNLGIVKDHVPQHEFYQYRYQVDVDGMSNAWISCFLKLYSKSAVLKVESDFEQWYYDEITPWEHYIPLARDLSDIDDVLEWLEHHDSVAERMVERANRVVNRHTYQSSLKEVGDLLSTILRCQKPA